MAEQPPTVLELVAQIVSAHCFKNTVAAEALPALIQHVHVALTQVDQPEQAAATAAEKLMPAVIRERASSATTSSAWRTGRS